MRTINQPVHLIGVDIGKSSSCSAIVVSRLIETDDPDEPEIHIIYIKRFELHIKIKEVINELYFIWNHSQLGPLCPIVILDASGNGGQQVYSRIYYLGIRPIFGLTITSTGKANNSACKVPKHLMVENMVEIFKKRRINISLKLKNVDLLIEEMRGYKSQPSPKAVTTSYRTSGRNGYDDLIDCISMTTWVSSNFKLPIWMREAEGLYPHSLPRPRPISGNREGFYSNLSRSYYSHFNPDFAVRRGWK